MQPSELLAKEDPELPTPPRTQDSEPAFHRISQRRLALAVFLFSCCVVIARRPDAILHAQFYAEDGKVWFADAYNLGWWSALFRAYHGYFQTLPRLGAALALLVPFSLAPLLLNCIAIALQAAVVPVLLSPRSSSWGSLRFRIALAAIYLVLPNAGEINAGITCSQWVLALIAFLLLVASPPQSTKGRIFDLSVILLCGLTGPFCIPLVFIALVLLLKRRSRWQWQPVAALAVTGFIQCWALVIKNPAGREHPALGASTAWFIRILSGQIYLGTLLGGNQMDLQPSRSFFIFLICVAIGGTAIVAICLVKATIELKLFLLFSAVLFVLSLLSPMAEPPHGMSIWKMLATSPQSHYWFLPMLAFAWSLLWLLYSRVQLLQITAATLLLLMCVGVIRDWRYPAFQDLQFPLYARRLAIAPQGTTIVIPLNPAGWQMELTKR